MEGASKGGVGAERGSWGAGQGDAVKGGRGGGGGGSLPVSNCDIRGISPAGALLPSSDSSTLRE